MQFRLGGNLMGAKFCGGTGDSVYIVCYFTDEIGNADPDTSYVVEATPNGGRLIGYFEYDLSSPAWYRGKLVVSDVFGNLHEWADDDWQIEELRPTKEWYVTAIRAHDDRLFALGVDFTFLERMEGQWGRILPDSRGTALLDTTLFSGSIHACGTKATFGTVSAEAFSQIEIPMSSAITSLLAQSNNLVLTGWKAFAALYANDELSILDTGERKLTIYNSADWNGEILFSATHDIARLEGTELVSVAEIDSKRLCTTENFVWSLGEAGLHFSEDGTDFQFLEIAFDL